jgi:Ca2+/H+ antiporter
MQDFNTETNVSSNAVELIVGIIALVHKEIIIVQTSLIGSMLSNLLLVMGMCFFFGGINRLEQHFNITVAQTAASILALSVGALLIPTAFTWGQGAANVAGDLDEKLSRGTAIIMLVVYGAYLFFQLKSHREIYNAPSKKVEKRKGSKKTEGDAFKAMALAGGGAAATAGGQASTGQTAFVEPDEEPEVPQLSLIGACVTLAIATALIGVCAEFLVDSINAVTCKYHVSEYFVGLILLPIVGNAAEHATAVTVAIKDKMDLAIGVAVGSSMQIALLVLPLMVILGWIIHADMTLIFDDFQIVVIFVAVILVNYLISDGKSRKYRFLVSGKPATLTLLQIGSRAFCSWPCISSSHLPHGSTQRARAAVGLDHTLHRHSSKLCSSRAIGQTWLRPCPRNTCILGVWVAFASFYAQKYLNQWNRGHEPLSIHDFGLAFCSLLNNSRQGDGLSDIRLNLFTQDTHSFDPAFLLLLIQLDGLNSLHFICFCVNLIVSSSSSWIFLRRSSLSETMAFLISIGIFRLGYTVYITLTSAGGKYGRFCHQ